MRLVVPFAGLSFHCRLWWSLIFDFFRKSHRTWQPCSRIKGAYQECQNHRQRALCGFVPVSQLCHSLWSNWNWKWFEWKQISRKFKPTSASAHKDNEVYIFNTYHNWSKLFKIYEAPVILYNFKICNFKFCFLRQIKVKNRDKDMGETKNRIQNPT